MDIQQMLDTLDREFADKHGFFSKRIDIDKCAIIVAQLKVEIPRVIEKAQSIVNSKNQILKNADNVAKHLLYEAQKRAEKSLEAAEVTHRAELAAQKIMGQAYQKSDQVAIHTQAHLDKLFFDAEKYLLQTLNMISDNRVKIKDSINIVKQE